MFHASATCRRKSRPSRSSFLWLVTGKHDPVIRGRHKMAHHVAAFSELGGAMRQELRTMRMRMLIRSAASSSLVGLLLALCACGGSSTSQGSEQQACYPNGTYNAGLTWSE
jgi:hypothetical protein